MCCHALVPWPLSSKSRVGVYEDRGVILTTGQPCLSLNPFPTRITPSPVVWLAFLAENMAETGQMDTNCPWNGAFLTPSWPSWWSWTLPPSFPAMSTSWGWFLPFTVSHFDLLGPRYAVAKAQNGNFGDGSRTVRPATQAKSVKMVKTFFPLEPSPRWLGDGQKKIYISSILTKVMGVQSQKYQKMTQKCHILMQIWG